MRIVSDRSPSNDRSILLKRTKVLSNYIEEHTATDVISNDITTNIIDIITQIDVFYHHYLASYTPSFNKTLNDYIIELKTQKVSFQRAAQMTQVITKLLSVITTTLHAQEPISSNNEDSELRKRLANIELALEKARSNPVLEEKMAQIEEELKKVMVTSAQAEEKEQEDLIKNYKTAKKKAFAIMPFNVAFDDIWAGGINRACTTEGFCCIRVDKISTSTWINDDIEECIELSDVVIADITGNNPNVMFELGWALAKGKKPIIIRQKDDNQIVPFDVQNYRHIKYINSWSGVETLCKQISKYMKSTASKQIKDKENP
jgi:nucleoside 2-deoxyribosyltransferase